MIRQLQIEDCPVVRLQGEELAAKLYPEFIPDLAKEVGILRELLEPRHYARAIGPLGAPTAVLLARVQDCMWATKKSATVVLWYSKQAPYGVTLMRDFKRWVRKQPRVVAAGFVDEVPQRDGMRGLGFVQRGGAHLYFPNGARR